MKLHAIKNTILAAALAVGLGVTGFSMMAQAAEAGTQAVTCSHSGEIIGLTKVTDTVNCGQDHYIEYETTYVCTDCGNPIKVEYETVYEPHDYEQIYLENGKVMSYCTVCGDNYIWSL